MKWFLLIVGDKYYTAKQKRTKVRDKKYEI